MTAGELADAFPVSKPTMSAHFAKLRNAGLIHAEPCGGSIIYTLNLSVVEEVVMAFMGRLRVGDTSVEPKEEEGDGPNLTLSPAVRRVVLEHHLDPSKIKGTGKDGRLTKDDVLAAAEGDKAQPAPPQAPEPAAAPAPAQPAPAPHQIRPAPIRRRLSVLAATI